MQVMGQMKGRRITKSIIKLMKKNLQCAEFEPVDEEPGQRNGISKGSSYKADLILLAHAACSCCYVFL